MNNIVVSRFNEDIEWIDLIDSRKYNFIIYNKGKDNINYKYLSLENIGRESHTFLKYILDHYYCLTDWTIFLQGEPFYACTDGYRVSKNILFEGISRNVTETSRDGISYKDFLELTKKDDFFGFDLLAFLNGDLYNCGLGDALIGGERHPPEGEGIFTRNYYKLFKRKKWFTKEKFIFMAGAQYCVNKNNILSRSYTFYEKCYEMHYKYDKFPWEMERYWMKIFFTDEKVKF